MVSIIRGYLRRIKKAKVCIKLLEFLDVERNLLLSRRLNNKQNVGQQYWPGGFSRTSSARSRTVGNYAFFASGPAEVVIRLPGAMLSKNNAF